ncbi:MAG: NYN domain-containing protein [Pseudanabaenaceae cyanobacterium bins.39]|nr:NYN domain-containing protein [Pseudanabaenaceae cyanobacterium bins.39]
MPSEHPPVMLVDGYNVIGMWRSLQEIRDLQGFDVARSQLTEAMVNFSAYHGYKTTLVFDAYVQATPARSEKVTKNLKLYFTDHNETADTYIERQCGKYRRDPLRHLKRIIVVTSDRAQQMTAVGFGAEWLSAIALEQEVEATNRIVQSRQTPKQANTKNLIGNRIDSKTKEELTKWRNRLN